jgi:hypothetical protein
VGTRGAAEPHGLGFVSSTSTEAWRSWPKLSTGESPGRGKGFPKRRERISISAVVTLWIAIPLQVAISLPTVVPSLAATDWYVATIIGTTNVLYFLFVAWQIRDVATSSRLSVV